MIIYSFNQYTYAFMKNGILTCVFYSFRFAKTVLESRSRSRSRTYTYFRKSIDCIFCVLENGYTYYVSLTISNTKIN